MKTRNLVGGLVVIAFLAGGYLSGLFPKIGLGPGEGPGKGPGTGHETVAVTGSPERTVQVPTNPQEDDDANAPQVVGDIPDDPRVLEVLLDGREYRVATKQGESRIYRPMELDDLVERARKKEGNSHGIKVRIRRLSSSRASAEEELKQALLDAGISQDSISWEPIE